MTNQIAAPCCGSCEHYCWTTSIKDYSCHAFLNAASMEGCCTGDNYSPRNPTPIIDIPGVKELVEEAYRSGVKESKEWPLDKIDDLTAEYMDFVCYEPLEDKNE